MSMAEKIWVGSVWPGYGLVLHPATSMCEPARKQVQTAEPSELLPHVILHELETALQHSKSVLQMAHDACQKYFMKLILFD